MGLFTAWLMWVMKECRVRCSTAVHVRGFFSCVYWQTSRFSEDSGVCWRSVCDLWTLCDPVAMMWRCSEHQAAGHVQCTVCHIVSLHIPPRVLWCSCVSDSSFCVCLFVFLAVLPPMRLLEHHMLCCSVSCRDALCLCDLLQNKDFSFSSLSSSGNKHHQRSPGEQPGDGSRGSRSCAGDPENHRALLPSARL